MSAELPPELRAAARRLQGEPLHLIDPETNIRYVLIPVADDRPVEESTSDAELAETYAAQAAAAAAAGWDEPEMSDYDDYDAKRKPLA